MSHVIIPFVEQLFTKHTVVEQNHMEIFFAEFHPKPSTDMEIMARNSFTHVVKQDCHCSDFHKNRAHSRTLCKEFLDRFLWVSDRHFTC